jgi:hypothetical protein
MTFLEPGEPTGIHLTPEEYTVEPHPFEEGDKERSDECWVCGTPADNEIHSEEAP